MDIASTVHALERAGLFWVPVPIGSKRPTEKNWQVPRKREIPTGPTNIGLLVRDGVIDVDLDSSAAARAATILASAGAGIVRFGRPSKPVSHVLVREDEPYKGPRRVVDPDSRALVLEVRTANVHVLVPPSIHPSGEQLAWTDDPSGLELTAERGTAERLVREVAAAALLVAAWEPGIRHEASLALAGWLLREGWDEDRVARLVEAVCFAAGDREARDRAATIAGTAATLEQNDPATGFPRLSECIGEQRAAAVAKLLVPKTGTGKKKAPGLEALLEAIGKREDIAVVNPGHGATCYRWTGAEWTASTYGVLRPAIIEEATALGMADEWTDRAVHVARLVEGGAVPSVVRREDEFDVNPYLLGLQDGRVLDLRTGEVRPQRREDMCTRRVGTTYDPNASRSLLLETLERAIGDRELVEYLQLLAGISLIGFPSKIMVVVYGPTDTGKTLFLVDGLRAALGDYAVELDPRRALANNERAEMWWSRAIGRRVTVLSEPPKSLLIDSAFVKAATGRGRVTVRRLYEQPAEVVPTWTIWVDTNSLPDVDDADDAIFNRIRAIPFVNRVRLKPGEAGYDPHFLSRWRTEAVPAILAWAVEGARLVLERFDDPTDLPKLDKDASMEWQEVEQEGTELEFVATQLEADDEAFVERKDVYEAYLEWAAATGRGRIVSRTVLYEAVKAAGIRMVKVDGAWGFRATLVSRTSENGQIKALDQSVLFG